MNAGPSPFETGGPLPPRPQGAFTIVVIPDSQNYLGAGCEKTPGSTDPVSNPGLTAQISWILSEKDRENIVFVTHVGDITSRNREEEWELATAEMDRLLDAVPFSVVPGNRDMTADGDMSRFQEFFAAERFAKYSWYLPDSSSPKDRRTPRIGARIFEAEATPFLHLGLECNATAESIACAKQHLRRYPERRCLVTSHMDLGLIEAPDSLNDFARGARGRTRWKRIPDPARNAATSTWDLFLRKEPTLDFIFCGDQSHITAMRRSEEADDGHIVHSLMSDYQSEPVLRLLRFLPSRQRVDVFTVEVNARSVIVSAPTAPEPGEHCFSLPWEPVREMP